MKKRITDKGRRIMSDSTHGTSHSTWARRRREGDVYRATRVAIDLAQKLHDARTAAGLSQKQLAELAGVRQGTISNIEQAEALPTLETLAKLTDA